MNHPRLKRPKTNQTFEVQPHLRPRAKASGYCGVAMLGIMPQIAQIVSHPPLLMSISSSSFCQKPCFYQLI